ncbi:hypothetical protein K474DRAFT_179046 [Panus rudis PR-1116 ss-1]|nr:hypothetical protein K474DRAFT_179046 [Panus rudis PR-1116 ss-1]
MFLLFSSYILSTANLAIRMVALWSFNKYLMALLSILIIGEIILMTRAKMSATLVPDVGCVPTKSNHTFLGAVHLYLMGLDFVIFGLTMWKIEVRYLRSQMKLAMALVRDGVLYILVSILVNAATVTMEFLNLSDVLNGISGIPVAVALTIAATRAVRNLHIQANRSNDSSLVPQHTTSSCGELD